MDRQFYYSFNVLSFEESSIWNTTHTLEEIRDNRKSIMKKALEEIPKDELPRWILVNQMGILGNHPHDVYISFRREWLFTKKGRRRRVSRALRMMGVPFVKVRRAGVLDELYELADDGFDVVAIAALKAR